MSAVVLLGGFRYKRLCLPISISFVIVYILQVSALAEAVDPVVDISTGRLIGSIKRSRDGRNFYEFLGIPYAEPPVGNLRFKPPLPAKKWVGVFNADQMGPECIQTDILVTGRLQGEEDCLTLNVFTPRIRTGNLLPVLVYFHGGFFMSGSKNLFRGKYFMDENVVLVTMNYRLGALGFLNTGDKFVRGNMGLKDQNLALKWIQENIHHFGGNKNQVTLSGESAGAACVQYHMLSPKSRDLFHRGISQSGSATRRYLLTDRPVDQAKHFAMQLDCPIENTELIVACLMRANASSIARVHREAISPNRHPYSIFGPTVEAIDDEEAFLTENPVVMLENGNFSRVPWITGVNSGEGLLYTAQILREKPLVARLDRDWDILLPRLLNYNPRHIETAKKLRDYYFGNSKIRLKSQVQVQNLTNMFSDKMFFSPTKKAAQLHSKYAPVYLYYFTYKTPISVYDLILGITPVGSIPPEIEFVGHLTRNWIETNVFRRRSSVKDPCHGDELSIIYNTNFFTEIARNSRHYPFSKALVKLWADFAGGNTSSSIEYLGTPWLPVQLSNDSNPMYLELNIPGQLIEEPFSKRLEFLNTLNLSH